MIHAQATKAAIMVAPQTIGTTAVSGYVDTLGYDYLTVDYIGATAVATDVITTLKLQHGDTTSAFTDITGGAPASIPAPNTNTPDVIRFQVDCRTKKRYINISIVGDATVRTTAVIGNLSRASQMPDTDTLAGCADIVYV